MQRMQIYFTDIQYRKLKELSNEYDMSMSEIVRRAIDDRFEKVANRIKDSLYVTNSDGTVELVDDMGEIK